MDVNEILSKKDGEEALKALKKAKAYAKAGNIIPLMDFLCPEDAKIYMTKNGPQRT